MISAANLARSMLLVGIATAGLSAHGQAQYRLVDTGVLGSGKTIAKTGAIAGQAGATFQSQGFRRVNGNIEYLVDEGSGAVVSGINSAGLVVGERWTSWGWDGVPTVWLADGSMLTLPTLGGSYGMARGINDAGVVVGHAYLPGDEVLHAFVFHNGTMTDLTPGSLGSSIGAAVNAKGVVTGSHATSFEGAQQGFIYKDGKLTDIGELAPGFGSGPVAINNKGYVVGSASTPQGQRAFVYDGVKMRSLGTLFGYSYANGINNFNVIVGVSGNRNKQRGWVRRNGTMYQLDKVLDASGQGWTVDSAYGINDAGEIIGAGTFAGQQHVVVLEPIAP